MKYIKSFGKLFESAKSRTEFKSGDKSEFYSEVNRKFNPTKILFVFTPLS